MKLMRIALMIVAAVFAAVSAHAQYSCIESNLNGKFVVEGGGKKVTLNLLGAVILEQEHNTTGYIVLDGAGNITDGKLDEEIDSTITEHTGVTGTYTLSGNLCSGNLTVQASGYQRTFVLNLTSMNVTTHDGDSFSLLPNGGNGEDEVYTAEKTDDPSTTNLTVNNSRAKLAAAASGGCTADMLAGQSFSGTVDGGTGGNTTKGTFRATFNPSEQQGLINITWLETDINNGVTIPLTTNNYNGVVNSDCSVEIDSGTTKVGEVYLSHKVSPTNSSLSTASVAAFAAPPVSDMTWEMPNGKWGKGEWATW